jgi:N-acetyl-anhydromuramyl-L-alanine amidase AmpD
MNLIQYNLSTNQYIQEETTKKQIYLHHTASSYNAKSVIDSWNSNKERIGVCVVIDGDGTIYQCYNSKYWGYHLGVKESVFKQFNLPYINLDKLSIGIEICCWGQLTKKGDKFYNYLNKEVPINEVIELDKEFKGYKYFHNYSDKQLDSLRDLLTLFRDKYNIDIKYNEDIFDVSKRALMGLNGVYTHNSVRSDKVDIYPNPRLIKMLKQL